MQDDRKAPHHHDQAIVRDELGQEQPADRKRARHKDQTKHRTPAAGPHDKPHLTDPDKTPGTGTLPPPGSDDDNTSG